MRRCPEIQLFAFVQMSNHLHLVLEDGASQLSEFMEYFLGNLARDLNRIDRVPGKVFERRYTPVEIVDDSALLDRILYTVANPVAAGLVSSVSAWPGLVLAPNCRGPKAFRRRRPARSSVRAPSNTSPRAEFAPHCRVVRTRWLRRNLDRLLPTRERAIRQSRKGRPFLGAAIVLQQNALTPSPKIDRSPIPLCHATTADGWFSYLESWRAFVKEYRLASAAYRAGAEETEFPEGSFPPGRPPLASREMYKCSYRASSSTG
jgi:hypothetical protein